MKVPCAYCGELCDRNAGGTDREGNELWFHHGDDDPWDVLENGLQPSCYEKAQWETAEEMSLLDFLMQPKEMNGT